MNSVDDNLHHVRSRFEKDIPSRTVVLLLFEWLLTLCHPIMHCWMHWASDMHDPVMYDLCDDLLALNINILTLW